MSDAGAIGAAIGLVIAWTIFSTKYSNRKKLSPLPRVRPQQSSHASSTNTVEQQQKQLEEKQKEAQNAKLDELWKDARKAVGIFGGLLEDNRYGVPCMVYDVSVLPAPKEALLTGVLTFIKLASPEFDQQVEGCAAFLPSLSQYQPNIGSEPLGADHRRFNLNVGTEGVQQLLTDFAAQKMPSDQLKAQVSNEQAQITQQISHALAERKKLWKR